MKSSAVSQSRKQAGNISVKEGGHGGQRACVRDWLGAISTGRTTCRPAPSLSSLCISASSCFQRTESSSPLAAELTIPYMRATHIVRRTEHQHRVERRRPRHRLRGVSTPHLGPLADAGTFRGCRGTRPGLVNEGLKESVRRQGRVGAGFRCAWFSCICKMP
jgi:hypothetical protein